jgi:hypothetical protein
MSVVVDGVAQDVVHLRRPNTLGERASVVRSEREGLDSIFPSKTLNYDILKVGKLT